MVGGEKKWNGRFGLKSTFGWYPENNRVNKGLLAPTRLDASVT